MPLRLLALLAILAVAIVGWRVVEDWRAALPAGPVAASGTVEADEVLLGPEVAGRLIAVPVEEGQAIEGGAVIARLDDALIQVQMRQADPATRRQLEVQADRFVIRSPVAGVVTQVPGRAGETSGPGQTVAAVSDLSRLKLTVYVLERDLGQVRVGQRVEVTADPFPGRVFPGAVTSINSRAEFTPRNVQTQRDRQNLVFGVKIAIDNADGALKPGLPVDARFAPVP